MKTTPHVYQLMTTRETQSRVKSKFEKKGGRYSKVTASETSKSASKDMFDTAINRGEIRTIVGDTHPRVPVAVAAAVDVVHGRE
jgi:hypothetical protein